MTIRLRLADFDMVGDRLDLGGRIVLSRDIVSVALQRHVSAASLACVLIGALLLIVCIQYGTWAAILIGVPVAALLFAGAIREWQHPYVLVLQVYQLGTFEIFDISQAALPTLDEIIAKL